MIINSFRYISTRTLKHIVSTRSHLIDKFTRIHSRGIFVCKEFKSNYAEEVTNFNGVHITVKNIEQTEVEFQHILKTKLKEYKDDQRRSVFLQIPIQQSHLIRVAVKYGFIFHHARNHTAVLTLWLDENKESKIPLFGNHQVGVAGACFNEDTDELLVVQDKGRYSKWWKFPGGFSEIGEFIGETAIRETLEETGIQSEFKSVLSLRQQHNVSFNQSDFYFICRLNPLSYDISTCPDEIENCEWIHINRLLEMNDTTPFVKLCCRLILHGKKTDFDNVDMIGTEMESWVTRNKTFVMYHRPDIT